MAEALSPQVLSTLIGSIYDCALAPNRWEGDTRREFIGAVPDERDDSNAMAAAYGLTPAETRVLASLLAGQTPAEIAVGLGIAATTAKTHLKNIFLKIGVSRQADLIRFSKQRTPPTRPAAP